MYTPFLTHCTIVLKLILMSFRSNKDGTGYFYGSNEDMLQFEISIGHCIVDFKNRRTAITRNERINQYGRIYIFEQERVRRRHR